MPSLRSSRVVLPEAVRPATIHHENGLVTRISGEAADTDFGDRFVLPGLVDSHVHVNEPGRTQWEGFSTATRAAAAGGTTTIVDMPLNSIPPTTNVPALDEKRSRAWGQISVDVAFWGGLIPGSEPSLRPLRDAGVCGFKSFMVDSGVEEYPPMTEAELVAALPTLASLGVPLLLHAEDPAGLLSVVGDATDYRSYLNSRPSSSERSAVSSAAEMASTTGARIHILHVSSAEAVGLLGGGALTGETCPHYLTFCSDDVGRGETSFKCAPPIRDAEHREALWDGLLDNSLSMVVSDHSPAPAELKRLESGDFSSAWGGIGSLQLRLVATWTGASKRNIEMSALASWLALEPARLSGLDQRKGSIEVGKDADFAIFDPEGVTLVRGSELEHRHPITPYEGMSLKGRVETTLLRGQTVFESGSITPDQGRMLRRND